MVMSVQDLLSREPRMSDANVLDNGGGVPEGTGSVIISPYVVRSTIMETVSSILYPRLSSISSARSMRLNAPFKRG